MIVDFSLYSNVKYTVPSERLELSTSGFEVHHSIQLSYEGRNLRKLYRDISIKIALNSLAQNTWRLHFREECLPGCNGLSCKYIHHHYPGRVSCLRPHFSRQ